MALLIALCHSIVLPGLFECGRRDVIRDAMRLGLVINTDRLQGPCSTFIQSHRDNSRIQHPIGLQDEVVAARQLRQDGGQNTGFEVLNYRDTTPQLMATPPFLSSRLLDRYWMGSAIGSD